MVDYWAAKLLEETQEILYGFPWPDIEREFRSLLTEGLICRSTETSRSALLVAERLRSAEISETA
jgi:hypothetical protein